MSESDFSNLCQSNFNKEKAVLSFFKYSNPVIREAIWQIKYKKNLSIAKIFAEIIYSEILEEISDLNVFGGSTPLLIPIPMGKVEKRKRGYNQTELLGGMMSDIDNGFINYTPNVLIKTKETERQTKLKKTERYENVLEAFEVVGEVKNKNIILLDDVLTTGATLEEVRRVLRKTGVKSILCVVIAR